jgi:ATP-binding cassette subfamily F protein uup
MLDRVSTMVLGLDGRGGAESFADYMQWEAWQNERKQPARAAGEEALSLKPARAAEPAARKKLSYMEAREFATLEERIAQAENVLQEKRAAAEDPAIATDAQRLLQTHAEMEQAQKAVDELYARWAELEAKQS